ncbi:MAG TPA: helix-turn-helix domain-containing protein [Solirubrobacterales bacterium]|nr:helix-turn-helix domain-containing protein [Solirubrobacterales bacterium]
MAANRRPRKKDQLPKTVKRTRKRKKGGGLSRLDDGLVAVLSHPLRVRMLASLKTDGDASAMDLSRRLNCTKHNAAYHMKVLKKYDAVELVRVEQRGSTAKRVYRAKVAVEFPTEIWDTLPPVVQGMVIAAVFMTSYADAEVALVDRVYEHRPESHASWSNLEVDEEGWREILKLTDGALAATKTVLERVQARREAAGDDQPLLKVSLNMSAFILPPDARPAAERVRVEDVAKRIEGKDSLKHSPPTSD